MRRETGIGDYSPIVGIVGNFSPYKDYETFIRAARIVADRIPEVNFVSIGNCDNTIGRAMSALVDELGLATSFHFLGVRKDVHKLLPGSDVFCSSSKSAEGFSNAICEGMASGVPCVVTDVGDSAMIVGDTGIVVPPRDPESFAEGILRLLRLPPEERQKLGAAARARIVEHFSIPRMVAATEQIYDRLLNDGN
jgi:glycosyltransferase involved in cell wall biosynthesis